MGGTLRDDLDKSLFKLGRILPEETQVRVFLTLDKGSIYRALCKAHVGHMEFVAESTAYDLHTATSQACESLSSSNCRA
jgi:ribosome-associated translation inhibitor RaiA